MIFIGNLLFTPQRMVDISFSNPDFLKVTASLNSRGRLVINVPRKVGDRTRSYWRLDRKLRIRTPRAREALDILSTALDHARHQQARIDYAALDDRS